MPLPRQTYVLSTVVGLLLLILGVLVGINLPVNQMNDRMAKREAALKAMAEEERKGNEAWRDGKVPPSPPVSFISRP
jgi:hypothetical protein